MVLNSLHVAIEEVVQYPNYLIICFVYSFLPSTVTSHAQLLNSVSTLTLMITMLIFSILHTIHRLHGILVMVQKKYKLRNHMSIMIMVASVETRKRK